VLLGFELVAERPCPSEYFEVDQFTILSEACPLLERLSIVGPFYSVSNTLL
jgi:hypothetical protein